MVEKIIVNPGKVRGLGNIVHPKMGDDFTEYMASLTVDTDTVNGVEETVYVLEPETSTISVSLSSSVASCSIGGSIVLSATVLEDDSPVSGGEVTFKLGSTVIGTDETDSSGIATFTYTASTAGSNNFTAYFENHSSNTVSVVVSKLTSTTTLSLASSSIIVGGSIVAYATVKQNNTGINGVTVTFKDGNTILGTGTTNSSGVATYTLTGLAVGSHSITAVASETDTTSSSTSSASTLTVLDHDYSISFSQASYPATGGSATLECTLLDNNVPVEGATISVSGSDRSLYSSITNSNGVAEVVVSNISTDTTFTCSYSNVNDTCTVTVPTYLYYDIPDSDRSSTYTDKSLQRSNYTNYIPLTYNSAGYYTIQASSGNTDYNHYVKVIPTLTGENNIKFSCEVKTNIFDGGNRFGILVGDNNAYKSQKFQIASNKLEILTLVGPATESNVKTETISSLATDTWYKMELTVQGTSYTFNLKTLDDTVLFTYTGTLSASVITSSTSKMYGLYYVNYMPTSIKYFRNIKAEAL